MAVQSYTYALPFGYDSEYSGITRAGADKYPNPFCDIASEYVPRELGMIFEWCEYIYLTMGTYRAATKRVVSYFLTDVVIDGESDSERDKYNRFLKEDLKIMKVLSDIGNDFLCYGNVFLSIYFPFDRYFICPHCKTEYKAVKTPYKFNVRDGTFIGDCVCGQKDVVFEREDRRSTDKTRVRIIRWNPKQIRIRVHPISHQTEYFLELDTVFVQHIREGKKFFIDETPWPLIKCVVDFNNSSTPPLFKFKDGAIFHMRDSTLSGIPIRGWAIPPILPNFRLAYYIQLLRRYDEALALDFIVPFRVLFPSGGPAGADPLSTMSMANFVGYMQQMVDRKRKNVADIQVAPFPIGYQMLGGEQKALAPKDSIAVAIDELLNAIGYPAELYKGSLSIQAFPVALRLFEKTWTALVDGMNEFIEWLVKRIAKQFAWGEVTGKLRSITLADDIERKALALQAAAGMDISKQTAYRPLGIDYLEEQRRVVEEQQEIQKLQREAMEAQQAQQFGGPSPDQGEAAPPGGTPGATPGDVYEQGKQLAQQLLFNTPPTLRRGELIKIKHSNPTLHAIVLQEMDNIRRELSRQGQAMLMQQQGAKTASADELPSPTIVGMLIADQICDYNRRDLRKIAMDIKNNIPHAAEVFHWLYSKLRGWE